MGIKVDPGVKARGPQTWEGVGAMLLLNQLLPPNTIQSVSGASLGLLRTLSGFCEKEGMSRHTEGRCIQYFRF